MTAGVRDRKVAPNAGPAPVGPEGLRACLAAQTAEPAKAVRGTGAGRD